MGESPTSTLAQFRPSKAQTTCNDSAVIQESDSAGPDRAVYGTCDLGSAKGPLLRCLENTPSPLVIAHRGASCSAPENTLSAYRLAVSLGADMVECDVRLTRDRVPVLMHDAELLRTTGVDGRVDEFRFQDVCRLDAGDWFDSRFAADKVPALSQALDSVLPRASMVLEIKEPDSSDEILEVVSAVRCELSEIAFFSFHAKAIREIAEQEPSAFTTWLVDEPGEGHLLWRDALREADRMRCAAIGLPAATARNFHFDEARDFGLPVFVWTANEPERMRTLARQGAAGIVTDYPDRLRTLLGRAVSGTPLGRHSADSCLVPIAAE